MNKADLLRHSRFRVHRVQHAHYESARIFDRRHFFIGVPSVILSTIVGTTVFASLKEISTQSDLVWPTIIVGLLSISSAVLTSLQTFLDYKGLAERHKLSGVRFADLKHKLEIIATFACGDDSDLRLRLTEIEQRWGKIREEGPNGRLLWRPNYHYVSCVLNMNLPSLLLVQMQGIGLLSKVYFLHFSGALLDLKYARACQIPCKV